MRGSRHIKALIDAGTWTDAAPRLLAVELPAWELRRLIYHEGEWHCAISRERELPEWLDYAIEGHHADLAMTILKAIVDGLGTIDSDQRGTTRHDTRRSGCKSLENASLMYCDNFG